MHKTKKVINMDKTKRTFSVTHLTLHFESGLCHSDPISQLSPSRLLLLDIRHKSSLKDTKPLTSLGTSNVSICLASAFWPSLVNQRLGFLKFIYWEMRGRAREKVGCQSVWAHLHLIVDCVFQWSDQKWSVKMLYSFHLLLTVHLLWPAVVDLDNFCGSAEFEAQMLLALRL